MKVTLAGVFGIRYNSNLVGFYFHLDVFLYVVCLSFWVCFPVCLITNSSLHWYFSFDSWLFSAQFSYVHSLMSYKGFMCSNKSLIRH